MTIFNTVPPLAAGTGLAFDGETFALAADATLSKQGFAADAKATGDTIRKAAPRNLLDNSDFRNPVNQRGATTYTGRVYGIDRWTGNSDACKLTVADGYIRMTNNTASSSTATQYLKQMLENPGRLLNKTVTLAAKVKGACRIGVEDGTYGTFGTYADWTVVTLTCPITSAVEGTTGVFIQGENKSDWSCQWIALYEGTYTAENLPEYQPKGYAVEMLACQRFFRRLLANGNGYISGNSLTRSMVIPLSTGMRTAPSVSVSSGFKMTVRGITGYDTAFPLAGGTPTSIALGAKDSVSTGGFQVLAINFTAANGGMPNNTPISFFPVNSSSYIDISADL